MENKFLGSFASPPDCLIGLLLVPKSELLRLIVDKEASWENQSLANLMFFYNHGNFISRIYQ